MIDAFIHQILLHEPVAGLFENVFGFVLPESKIDKESPLSRFLREISIRLPMYETAVFVFDARRFLTWNRIRIWIAFSHKDCGGARTMHRVKLLVQASVSQS